MTTERARLHEAGHAVVAWRLGHRLELVSVKPSAHGWGFVSHVAVNADPASPEPQVPVVLQRGTVRQAIERLMCIALAGHAAELLLAPPAPAGYGPAPDEEEAERLEATLAELSPVSRELLADAEARSTPTDADRAVRFAELLAGSEHVHHLGLMRAVAFRLVAEDAERIETLAAALADRPVMSGEEAVKIIEDPRGGVLARTRPRSVPPSQRPIHIQRARSGRNAPASE